MDELLYDDYCNYDTFDQYSDYTLQDIVARLTGSPIHRGEIYEYDMPIPVVIEEEVVEVVAKVPHIPKPVPVCTLPVVKELTPEEEAQKEFQKLLDITRCNLPVVTPFSTNTLESIGLSTRAYNALVAAVKSDLLVDDRDVELIDIIRFTADDMSKLKGIGKITLQEIISKLNFIGITLLK